eukprot:871680-Rhodomonas_salina.2
MPSTDIRTLLGLCYALLGTEQDNAATTHVLRTLCSPGYYALPGNDLAHVAIYQACAARWA